MFSNKIANKMGWKAYQYEQSLGLLAFLGIVSMVTGVNPVIVAPIVSAGLFGLAYAMGDKFSLTILMILSSVGTGLFFQYPPVLLGGLTFSILFLCFITLPWAWKKGKTGEAFLGLKELIK